jgi:hypothetical protein
LLACWALPEAPFLRLFSRISPAAAAENRAGMVFACAKLEMTQPTSFEAKGGSMYIGVGTVLAIILIIVLLILIF